MRILVLYETRRGFTLSVARAIRDELRGRGLHSTAAPIRGIDAGSVAAADAFIVGTWVSGKILFGVGPARGALDGIAALPPLTGRPAAVFCTFDVAPRATLRMMDSRLVGRGARVGSGSGFRNGPFPRVRARSLARVPAFVDEALESFTRPSAVAPR